MLRRALIAASLFIHAIAFAQPATFEKQSNVFYRPDLADNDYARELCVLDVYQPSNDKASSPILIWFHGGGLEGGSKTSGLTKKLAESFAAQGITVVVPDYRLSPQVQYPTYLQDAAAAVRYVQTQVAPAEKDTDIFVGGHSAGAYIAFMLAMDPSYFSEAGVEEDSIDGFIPMSGQIMTHFTVAKEKGIARPAIMADEASPIYHIRPDTAPILVLIGGNDWPARLEENRYFVAAMRKVAENEDIALVEVPDRDHGGILKGMSSPEDPAAVASLSFIRTGDLPADHTIPSE